MKRVLVTGADGFMEMQAKGEGALFMVDDSDRERALGM